MSPSREDGVGETIDFWVAHGPCRAIAPVLKEVVEESDGRATPMKLNVDESAALAARYGIRSIPTLLFFKDGTLVDRVVGAAPKTVLQSTVSTRAS